MATRQYPAFQPNALVVLARRYLKKDAERRPTEEPTDMLRRVAHDISLAELEYGHDEAHRQQVEDMFFEVQRRLHFLANSPTMMNAGRELQQLSACFVLPVEDSLDSIFTTVKNTATIHQTGGGTGFSFSKLRPEGDLVGSTGGVASGPVSFMQVYDAATEVVKQGGTRRGANMAIMDCTHPDIVQFVDMKLEHEVMNNFNVSVSVSDEFMHAAQMGYEWQLYNPRNGEPWGSVNATELLHKIVANAWATGDPGMVFLDRVNEDHPNQHLGRITATNPCVTGECWVMTQDGPRQVDELVGKEFRIMDEYGIRKTDERGFYPTGNQETYWLKTSHGYRVRLTAKHRVKRIVKHDDHSISYDYVAADQLQPGDLIPMQQHQEDWPAPTGGDRQPKRDADAVAQGRLISATAISEMHRCSSKYHLEFMAQILRRTGVATRQKTGEPVSMLMMLQPPAPIHDVQQMLLRLGVMSKIIEDGLFIEHRELCTLLQRMAGSNEGSNAGPHEGNNPAVLPPPEQRHIQPNQKERTREHVTEFVELEPAGPADVYDVTVDQSQATPGMPVFDGQGFILHNCLSGNTRLSTHLGPVTLEELYWQHKDIQVLTDARVPDIQRKQQGSGTAVATRAAAPTTLRDAVPVFRTRTNWPTFRLRTKHGFQVVATDDHKFYTPNGPVELKDLKAGDEVLLQGGAGTWNQSRTLPEFTPVDDLWTHSERGKGSPPTEWSQELGQLLGWTVTNGWISTETPKGRNVPNYTVVLTFGSKEQATLAPVFQNLIKQWLGTDGDHVERHDTMALQYKSTLYHFLKSLGLSVATATEKRLPDAIWTAPQDAVQGFLSAMFTADGIVNVSSRDGSCSIQLASSSRAMLQEVQLLLLNFGIVAKIYGLRPGSETTLPDTNHNPATYDCAAQYELLMDGKSRETFLSEIGFMTAEKQDPADNWQKTHGPAPRREPYTDQVESIEFECLQDVYCTTESETHSIVANGFVTAQCGEQPLLEYESCNLGSINLAQIRRDAESDEEFERILRETCRIATRFLDNVIDRNRYAIEEIDLRTKATRRIGVGVMGFADLLIMEGIRYDSHQGIERAHQLMKFIQSNVHEASRDLAEERGPYPEWYNRIDAEPDEIPMRNTSPTTIAPTGTISVIAGVSSGIEPLFALAYERHVMDNDRLPEFDRLFLEAAERHGIAPDDERMLQVLETGSLQGLGFPKEMEHVFRVSHEITAEWHVRMQAAWQEFCDNAVSKTVNMPQDATQEDVMNAYRMAWETRCKGITVYRDGSKVKQVLSTAESRRRDTAAGAETEENRHGPDAEPKYRRRPDMLPGVTHRIPTGHGTTYITVNSDSDGRPFEVFVAGGKSGGCDEANSQAITRLATLAMRHNVEIDEIRKQLTDIVCCPTWVNGQVIGSLADAIAEALKRHTKGSIPEDLPTQMALPPAVPVAGDDDPTTEELPGGKLDSRTYAMLQLTQRRHMGLECPISGCNGTMIPGEGCGTCRTCGYSDCS